MGNTSCSARTTEPASTNIADDDSTNQSCEDPANEPAAKADTNFGCDYVKYSTPSCPHFTPKSCNDVGLMCQSAFHKEHEIVKCVMYTSLSKNNPYLNGFSTARDVKQTCCDASSTPKGCYEQIPISNSACVWNTATQSATRVGADETGVCSGTSDDVKCALLNSIKCKSNASCKWNPEDYASTKDPSCKLAFPDLLSRK